MSKKRYDNKFPSVTEVLSYIRKPGLEYWFKNNSAQECEKISARSKEIGTQIHKAIEHSILKTPFTTETEYYSEVSNALTAFNKFRSEVVDDFTFSEMKLTSETLGLNGTIDCIKEIDNKVTILDWKTGECKGKEAPPIYTEYLLQVSAYYHLYHVTSPEKAIEKALVVSLAKDKPVYNYVEITSSEIIEIFEGCFVPLFDFVKNYKKLEASRL